MNENLRKKISLGRSIARSSPHIPKSAIAKTIGFSRGSLYKRLKQPEKDKALLSGLLEVLADHPYYGHRRIALALGKSRNTILRIMRKYNLGARKRKKRFKKPPKLPQSDIPNRIKGLCPIGPNVFWAGDFTHLHFHGVTVYLATVIDLYTREIVGFSVGLHHSADLVLRALDDALTKRVGAPSVFHSDQGSEYQSQVVRRCLMAHRILPSHSQKSHPWENGLQESFYRSFKQELGTIHQLMTVDELFETIAQHLFTYNTKRIHSVLKMPPLRFLEEWRAQQQPTQSDIHSVH